MNEEQLARAYITFRQSEENVRLSDFEAITKFLSEEINVEKHGEMPWLTAAKAWVGEELSMERVEYMFMVLYAVGVANALKAVREDNDLPDVEISD